MYNIFSKFLIAAMLLPVCVVLLPKDCDERKPAGARRASEANNKMDEAQTGLWGGEGVRLEITAQGAQIEYACAHGTIDRKIVADANGNFSVGGTHVRERGGPTRDDETANSRPALFTGQIKGKTMSLTVTSTETKEVIGTFTLTYGQQTRLIKCR